MDFSEKQWFDDKELLRSAEDAFKQKKYPLAFSFWEKVRELSPQNPQGYIRAGLAALHLKDYTLSKELAEQAMEKFPQAVKAFVLYAEVAMSQKDFASALERWERVRKSFPAWPQGYIHAGFAALHLKDFALAEKFAEQAMEKFPQAVNAVLLYAEIAMRREDFASAQERWKRVRESFPSDPRGYVRAGEAALRCKNIALAENIAEQAGKVFPNAEFVLKLRAKIAGQIKQLPAKKPQVKPPVFSIVEIAEAEMRMGLFKDAFTHFRLAIRKCRPLLPQMFIGAAKAAINIGKASYAQRLCEDALKYFPQNFAIHQQLVLCFEEQKKFDAALAVLDDMKHRFPACPYGWTKGAEIYLQIGNYEQADRELKEAISLFPDNVNVFLDFAKLPFLVQNTNWTDTIARYKNACLRFNTNYHVYWESLRRINNLIAENSDVEAVLSVYRFLFRDFIGHFRKEKTADVAILVRSLSGLKFILPVVKCLPCRDIIVAEKKDDETYIQEFGIQDYNIIYGKENVNRYRYVFVDHLVVDDGDYTCRFIGYNHATDNSIVHRSLNRLSLAILSSQKQMTSGAIACAPLSEEDIVSIDTNHKCEICYTGPYHLGDFLTRRHESKAVLKEELAEKLEIEIPKDKPLVFILEDEISCIGQLAYAANKMSRYATVIYKSLLPSTDPRLAKFNGDVHITRGGLAPNLLRFSADYVCCGYMSGSFTTTVMLGQNVLPFYSKIVEVRDLYNSFRRYSYKEYIEGREDILFSSKYILYSKFQSAGKLLDLVDAASMEKAILGTEYRDWYQASLPELQKEAFGDYMLEGSPQKTAEYIMRFVKDGTLGKDCSAIYLKEKYFKA